MLLNWLKKIKVRRLQIGGYFPIVRLISIIENPKYLIHLFKKNFWYKRFGTDYSYKYDGITFLSGQSTLNKLIENRMSLARFSDGEIEQIVGAGEYPPDSDWSQRNSSDLVQAIEDNLSCRNPRLLVAVDPPSTFLAKRGSKHDIEFGYNMWVDMRRILWRYLDPKIEYGHCHLFIKQNCPDLDWSMLRDYLASKHVIVATGNTHLIKHLSLGKTTHFIECGTVDAFERKDKIKSSILEKISQEKFVIEDVMVMACLGPTAGIIAQELLLLDLQVWDTGHIFEFASSGFLEETFLQS